MVDGFENVGDVRVLEDRFISRVRENIAAVACGGVVKAGDEIAVLRKLTGGKYLRAELAGRYPSGSWVSARVGGAKAVVLTGRVVLRLGRYVEAGGDDEPMGLRELHDILAAESKGSRRGRYVSVLGLFSPTGWTGQAVAFVKNEPCGSGHSSGDVAVVLVGPGVTELVWDAKSKAVSEYITCFCGLTAVERQELCRKVLDRDLAINDFAVIENAAKETGYSVSFVLNVANGLAGESEGLIVKKISQVGFVLKRSIQA